MGQRYKPEATRYHVEYYRRDRAGELRCKRARNLDQKPTREYAPPGTIEMRVYELLRTENWEEPEADQDQGANLRLDNSSRIKRS